MSNSIAPGSSTDVNIKVTALTTNPNVPVTYKTIILKKNLVNGVNTLTQAMMNQTNTKYVIKYDYVLSEDIIVPPGCILEFDGGSISASGSDDTITGANTGINAGLVKIFNTDITLAGNWNVVESYPEWFGAVGNGIIDDAVSINKVVQSVFDKVIFSDKTYAVNDTITLNHSINLIGIEGFTKIYNLKKNSTAAILANGIDNIILDGLEIDFNADSETGYDNTLCFRNGIIDLKDCNKSIIRHCKVYNVRNQMSNIIFQGDYNEVEHCEIYTGNGNRMTSGIVMGWFNMADTTHNSGGVCKYAKVHDCYVHDISIGNEESESGYGIYFLSGQYCEAYNNVAENCNWVCINCQAEGNIRGGHHNKIYNNVTRLNSESVYPKQDYFGPFNIYIEAVSDCEILNNIIICGSHNGTKHLPIMVSDYCSGTIVRGNKIIEEGTASTIGIAGIDDDCLYEDNICKFTNFTPDYYFYHYGSRSYNLTIRNCNIKAANKAFNFGKSSSSYIYTGNLIVEGCEIIAPQVYVSSGNTDSINVTFKNCVFDTTGVIQGDGFIVDYNSANHIIEDCVFKNIGSNELIRWRYASNGKFIVKRNTFIGKTNHGCYLFTNRDGSGTIELIDFSDNTVFMDLVSTFLFGRAITNNIIINNNSFDFKETNSSTIAQLIYLNNLDTTPYVNVSICGNIFNAKNDVTNLVDFPEKNKRMHRLRVLNNIIEGIANIGFTNTTQSNYSWIEEGNN